MNVDFAALMSRHENAFYPLRLMSSDFFVPYWRCFIPADLAAEHVRIAQDAARRCVDYAMRDEEVYWAIDLSEENALATWRMFVELTAALPPEPMEHVKMLAVQIAVSSEESDSADFLENHIARVRLDHAYRRVVGCSDGDADVLDAAYERADESFLSMSEIKDAWLDHSSPWDLHLKSQTPDFPESAAVIFSMAYGARTILPLLRANLRTVLETESEYRAFVDRLERSFTRALSPNMDVKFPALLRV